MTDNAREIENLVYTYAERIDAGDLDGLAAKFKVSRRAMEIRLQGLGFGAPVL